MFSPMNVDAITLIGISAFSMSGASNAHILCNGNLSALALQRYVRRLAESISLRFRES
jgi:hypothetical protein